MEACHCVYLNVLTAVLNYLSELLTNTLLLDGACTWHADAFEASNLVQAGGIVLARVGHALVDIEFTAGTHIACGAFALKRALGVNALPSVLTRVGTCRVTQSHHQTYDRNQWSYNLSGRFPIQMLYKGAMEGFLPSEHSSMS